MLVLRRYTEAVTVVIAIGALVMGLHRVPALGETYVAEGRVHVLEAGPKSVVFGVGERTLSSYRGQDGFELLRQSLVEGTVMRVVGWPGGAWPDARDAVLEVTFEGRSIVSRGRREAEAWFLALVYLALACGSAWWSVYSVLRGDAFWARYYEHQKAKEEETSLELGEGSGKGRTRGIRQLLAGLGLAGAGFLIVRISESSLAEQAGGLAMFFGGLLVVAGIYRSVFGFGGRGDTPARRIGFGVTLGCFGFLIGFILLMMFAGHARR